MVIVIPASAYVLLPPDNQLKPNHVADEYFFIEFSYLKFNIQLVYINIFFRGYYLKTAYYI